MPPPVCVQSFVLTVSESKRLIARALKRHPAVISALNRGIVAVAKGTTNAYVAEELLGEGLRKPDYCAGVTTPAGTDWPTANALPDLVLRNGKRMEGTSATEIAAEMGPEDVFVKGANALGYDRRQAGILIGHPTGGTIGAVLGTLTARRVRLLIPVGLEKSVPGDLHEMYRLMSRGTHESAGPALWPVDGEVFTEIEALQLYMAGGGAAPIGAGGIAGAEGSVRIAVWGAPDQVSRAEGAIRDVQGEPPFIA